MELIPDDNIVDIMQYIFFNKEDSYFQPLVLIIRSTCIRFRKLFDKFLKKTKHFSRTYYSTSDDMLRSCICNMNDNVLHYWSESLDALFISWMNHITSKSVSTLTNLRSLVLASENIDSKCIANLINLTSLAVLSHIPMEDEDLSLLTNLRELSIFSSMNNITDDGITKLSNLTSLILLHSSNITTNAIKQLPNLLKYNRI